LRRRVNEAHRRAEAQIKAARQSAREIVAEAEAAGRAEAEAMFQQGVDEARQQAEEIVAAARREAATLRAQTTLKLDDVAARIVALVLPAE